MFGTGSDPTPAVVPEEAPRQGWRRLAGPPESVSRSEGRSGEAEVVGSQEGKLAEAESKKPNQAGPLQMESERGLWTESPSSADQGAAAEWRGACFVQAPRPLPQGGGH